LAGRWPRFHQFGGSSLPVVPEIHSPGFNTIAGTVVLKSHKVSSPKSWKLVMFPLPRARFRLITVNPVLLVPSSVSSRFTSVSPLFPNSGPSPGPSLALPTCPPWQIEQVTPMLPLHVPSALCVCVSASGSWPEPPSVRFGSSPGSG
jgi:hypothetical protein